MRCGFIERIGVQRQPKLSKVTRTCPPRTSSQIINVNSIGTWRKRGDSNKSAIWLQNSGPGSENSSEKVARCYNGSHLSDARWSSLCMDEISTVEDNFVWVSRGSAAPDFSVHNWERGLRTLEKLKSKPEQPESTVTRVTSCTSFSDQER